MMAAIAETLGPDRVCCLTGVTGESNGSTLYPIYRRPRAFSKSKVIEGVALGATLLEIATRHRPQAVQLATVEEGYLGLFLKHRFGLPYVVYVHGNEIAALAARKVPWDKPTKALIGAEKVFAVSSFTADLARRIGVRDERVEVLHPGCDSNFFEPRPPDAELRRRLLRDDRNGPVVLTVGNLVERKGHDVVITAMSRLTRERDDLTYLIVGDGPFRNQLQRLSVELGVARHVVFAGQVPRAVLPDIYALADLFVMPSRHRVDACDVEGFGLVFLEAGACGKPVIGGKSGGVSDAIEDGGTGFVVDANDVAALAERITWLIRNPSQARQMGIRGRQRVVERFSWKNVSDRVLAAFA